jgi:molybdopterin converting factor small subunit
MFESPVVSIHLSPGLRSYVGGHDEITVSGDTVSDLIDALGHEYPALRSRLISSAGELLPGLAVYLGGRSLGDLQGLATPVGLEEVVSIVATGAG